MPRLKLKLSTMTDTGLADGLLSGTHLRESDKQSRAMLTEHEAIIPTNSSRPSKLINNYSRRKGAFSMKDCTSRRSDNDNTSYLEKLQNAATNDLLAGRSSRDNIKNVMESCQMRTVIDNNFNNCKKVRNAQSSGSFSSNSNKSCSSVIVSKLLPERIWKDRQRHYQPHHNRFVNSDCLRTFIVSVVVILLSCTTSITLVHGQPPPLPPAGFLDFDNLPVTRFSCEGKVIGGYYADVETGCQMFHVCTLGQKDEIQDIKFLCLNGTVFDQETRVCERVDEVDCSKAEQYFDLNLDLYVPHATTQKPEEADLEEEDDNIRPVATTKPKATTTTTTTTTTTKATTTTTRPTPTPSPRTRPPSTSSKSRSPPVVSSSSQEDEEESGGDDEGDDNGYTSFNYYLKTPHSHVASGYNSQSRQSYLYNQPGPTVGRSTTNNGNSNTGRKTPTGPKTIVYSSSSTSSSTARPKTVLVVKATLPPPKSSFKPKVTLRATTTTTSTPSPSKFELDEQYDEYYDDEDYTEPQPSAPQSPAQSSSSKQASYQNPQAIHSHYQSPKPAVISSGSFDFRDGRSTKGVENAGAIISSTTGKSGTDKSRQSLSVAVSSTSAAVRSNNNANNNNKQSSSSPSSIKVISSEFLGNNSTEEPYYYEDDYPDDVTLQQQQQDQQHQLQNSGFTSSSTSKSVKGNGGSSNRGKVSSSESTSSTPNTRSSGIRNANSNANPKNNVKSSSSKSQQNDPSQSEQQSTDTDDYYDDDNDNVNAHDHHFTHVDVPRIPFAKPNVPRVLVTNGKPFLPRLRRQSHHHLYSQTQPIHQQQHPFHPIDFLLPAAPSGPVRRSSSYNPHQNRHYDGKRQSGSPAHTVSSTELRREARAKAREWGRDHFR